MGCIEFWAVNCALGSLMFLILFILVESQDNYFRYKIEHKGSSATGLIFASIFYAIMTVLLTLWYMQRQKRMQQALQYQTMQTGPQVKQTTIRAQAINENL